MGNTSLVLSDLDLTIDEKQQLFDVLQFALINDSTNLYQLQEMFYPPGVVSPDTVVFKSTVTVNTILLPDNSYYGCYPAFVVNILEVNTALIVISFQYLMMLFQVLKQT